MPAKKKSPKKPIKKNPDALLADEYGKEEEPAIVLDKDKKESWLARMRKKYLDKKKAEAAEGDMPEETPTRKMPVKINKDGPLGAVARRRKEYNRQLKALEE